jgi:hypothetical protein
MRPFLLLPLFLAACASPRLPLEPVSVLELSAIRSEISADAVDVPTPNISAPFNKALVNLLGPPTEDAKEIFAGYSVTGHSVWSDNWLRGFDFSGVAWDSTRAGTLITPRHVIMAKHYPRAVGSKLTFHLPNGDPLVRTLVDRQSLSITDVSIGLLDEPATGCAVYPIMAPGYDWEKALYGAYGFVCDQERKVLLYQLTQFNDLFVGLRGSDDTTPAFMREPLISGDSGHPAFFPYGNNQLILLTCHWFGGAGTSGPNPSGEMIKSAIIDAVNVMDARNPQA